MEHSDDYRRLIHSEGWSLLRLRIIKQRGNKCERCNVTGTPLALHHKTYERLGRELDSDLELLCPECHIVADKERVRRVEVKRATNFVRAKYGDSVAGNIDHGEALEELHDWLERRG